MNKISIDVENLFPNLTNEELVKLVRDKQDKEAVLGALKELSKRDRVNKYEIFQEVLKDPEQSSSAKRTIASSLGREKIPETQELLLQNLNKNEPLLFAAIVQSLGRIGDENVLKRLEDIDPPDNDTAKHSFNFAKSLLSYRLRIDKYLIPEPPDSDIIDVSDGISVEAKNASLENTRAILSDFKKRWPAFELDAKGAAKLNCRSIELLLVFFKEFAQPRLLKTLKDNPAMPLVMLKKAFSLDRYFIAQYFFTHPAKGRNKVTLLGTRPDGSLTYTGKANISEKTISFQLQSIDSRYVPAIDFDGSFNLEKSSWNFKKAVSSTKVAAKENTAETPRKVSPKFD